MSLLAEIPGACAWLSLYFTFIYLPLWAAFLLAPAVLTLAFCAPVALVRFFSPRSAEKAARVAGLRYFLQAFYLTRYLHYRALGAKTHFSTNFALDVDLRGMPWMRFGPRATVALHASVHATKDAPVTIGDTAFIGKGAHVPPGCNIGDQAFVGVMNALEPGEVVPPGTRIPDYSRMRRA